MKPPVSGPDAHARLEPRAGDEVYIDKSHASPGEILPVDKTQKLIGINDLCLRQPAQCFERARARFKLSNGNLTEHEWM